MHFPGIRTVRISRFARECNITSKELIGFLNSVGFTVKSSSSMRGVEGVFAETCEAQLSKWRGRS